MSLDLKNGLFDGLKESEFMKKFIDELNDFFENKNSIDYEWNNLVSNDLILYDTKITTKYRDKILLERRNILESYAEKTVDNGEMYYVYNESSNEKGSYNLTNCNLGNHEVLIKSKDELPYKCSTGTVLRKENNNFVIDEEATKEVNRKINSMIKEKILEQEKYLRSKRIDGHIYEVGEKYSGRIWLYDLSKDSSLDGVEGIEEINFSKELYSIVKEGDLLIYKDGEYYKK